MYTQTYTCKHVLGLELLELLELAEQMEVQICAGPVFVGKKRIHDDVLFLYRKKKEVSVVKL